MPYLRLGWKATVEVAYFKGLIPSISFRKLFTSFRIHLCTSGPSIIISAQVAVLRENRESWNMQTTTKRALKIKDINQT